MGPPLKKPTFLEVSRRQQRRRINALLEDDVNLIRHVNTVNNPPMPSCLPRSRSPLIIPPAEDVFEDEINYLAGNLELLNDTAFVDVRPPIPIPRDTQIDGRAQSTTIDSASRLRNFLAYWAIKNKISQFTVNEILAGLKKCGHPELPAAARTLCETPSRGMCCNGTRYWERK